LCSTYHPVAACVGREEMVDGSTSNCSVNSSACPALLLAANYSSRDFIDLMLI
jgi:hypothetical protein